MVGIKLLSSTDRDRAMEAIRGAEAKTAGEFVVAVARESDSYQAGPLSTAAVLALGLPFFNAVQHGIELSTSQLTLAQMFLFALMYGLCSLNPLRRWLTPTAIRARRVRRAAVELFFSERVHATRSRSGILLYVSLAEHQVELVADIGIDTRVKPGAWDGVIADFVAQVRRGEMGHGLAAAITGIGDILAEHFPPEPGQSNELPDRLIEL